MIFSKKQKKHPPLFETVSCICLFSDKILLLKRNNSVSYPGKWGLPTGKIKENEPRLKAIIREVYEETGILLSKENLKYIKTYHINNEEFSFLYSLFHCSFEREPKVTISKDEHDKFIWAELNDALRLNLVPDLKEILNDNSRKIEHELNQMELFPERFISSSILDVEKNIDRPEDLSNYFKSSNIRRPLFIAFGPPATGKTTNLKEMKKNNPSFNYIRDDTILKGFSRLYFYLEQSFKNEYYYYLFHFQMEILTIRFLQILKAPNNSLIDETIFSTLAYTKAVYRMGWLSNYEYQTFYSYYLIFSSIIPIPEHIYFFHCNIDTIQQRIQKRGRKIEDFYTREYLEALHKSFEEVAQELSDKYKITWIDTSYMTPKKICEKYGPG